MYCHECGKKISDKSIFCRFCGSAQKKSSIEKQSERLAVDQTYRVASQNVRFLHFVIDFVATIIWMYVWAFIIGYLWGLYKLDEIYSFENINWTLMAYVFSFLYFFVLESLFGKTLGKLLTSTRVVTRDGRECTKGAIFIRSLCRYIPFDAFTFLFAKYPVGWHDSISQTRVIYE